MSEVSGKTFDAPLLKRVLKYVKPYLIFFMVQQYLQF